MESPAQQRKRTGLKTGRNENSPKMAPTGSEPLRPRVSVLGTSLPGLELGAGRGSRG